MQGFKSLAYARKKPFKLNPDKRGESGTPDRSLMPMFSPSFELTIEQMEPSSPYLQIS